MYVMNVVIIGMLMGEEGSRSLKKMSAEMHNSKTAQLILYLNFIQSQINKNK